jgi:hypothetical protein
MLGIRSHFDDIIEILETDSKGRTLYLFQPRDYIHHAESITAVFICQASDRDFVYYYPLLNFFISETYYSTESGNIPFSKNEIDQLKEQNDWDDELKPELYRRKSITRMKDDYDFGEKEALEVLTDNEIIPFIGDTQWICYWDKDEIGKHIFLVQDLIWNRETETFQYLKTYIAILYNDKTLPDQNVYIEIDQITSYNRQLSEFLAQHDWR